MFLNHFGKFHFCPKTIKQSLSFPKGFRKLYFLNRFGNVPFPKSLNKGHYFIFKKRFCRLLLIISNNMGDLKCQKKTKKI